MTVSRSVLQGLFWAGLIAAVLGVATLSVASRAGAQEPRVRLEIPPVDATVGDAPFPVEIVIDDVVNLGAFEFRLGYDASILRFVDVSEGPFLGSSGRMVECLDPRLTPESVHFLCVTLGPEPPGADGSGTLATVTLELVGSGTSPLRFEALTLAQPDAQRISATSEDTFIAFTAAGVVVTPMPVATPTMTAAAVATGSASIDGSSDGDGTNWALWGSVIGAATVLVLAAAGAGWWFRARKPT